MKLCWFIPQSLYGTLSLSLLKEIHSGICSKWKVHHISSAQTDLYLFTGGGEWSLSAGEIIVRHKFLVLGRERQALLRIMLPIENSVGGYVRQIAVPHHHTTGSGFIHESVTHNNTEGETRHGETRTCERENEQMYGDRMSPKAHHDVLKCLLSSTTTQRCSAYCHWGVNRPENIHLSWAGIRELLIFFCKAAVS